MFCHRMDSFWKLQKLQSFHRLYVLWNACKNVQICIQKRCIQTLRKYWKGTYLGFFFYYFPNVLLQYVLIYDLSICILLLTDTMKLLQFYQIFIEYSHMPQSFLVQSKILYFVGFTFCTWRCHHKGGSRRTNFLEHPDSWHFIQFQTCHLSPESHRQSN